jgi:hypothetical protein
MLGDFLTLREFLEKFQDVKNVTLLGIGPVSTNTIIASLSAAAEYDFPLFLIASRNQVDKEELGGGYLSGWDQRGFVNGVKELAEMHGSPKAVYFCRDHGGPWQRDKELNQKIPHDEAMAFGKASFLADLKAGFDLLHIDPTKNPFLKEADESMAVIIRDTVELIAASEQERKKLNLPEVAYEVGTEDIRGGLTQSSRYHEFLVTLKKTLTREGLPLPNFIVGQTGTLVKLDGNYGFFNPDVARKLAGIARENGCFLKEHNTDYLDEETLKMHPVLGISSANVAPEFGVTETKTVLRLSYLAPSGETFRKVLTEQVFSENRWQKWLPENLKNIKPEDFRKDQGLNYKAVVSCGHYYLDQPEVLDLKEKFFREIITQKKIDPKEEVIASIKKAIFKYVDAFNLTGLNKEITR